jgi:hypothetical protein
MLDMHLICPTQDLISPHVRMQSMPSEPEILQPRLKGERAQATKRTLREPGG